MTRPVSVFFDRSVQGYSEPGTCPRCARSVHVSRFGKPKAHRCPHRLQCTPGGEGCSRCKAARELPAAKERCCDAAVAMEARRAAWADARAVRPANHVVIYEAMMKHEKAIIEAHAAGAELARLRGAT